MPISIVGESQRVLQKFKINVRIAIVALPSRSDHDPLLTVRVFGGMNQGVPQIDLVSYRAVRPAPGVGVIVRLATLEVVILRAVRGVKQMISSGRVEGASRGIQDAAAGAESSRQPIADAVSGCVGNKVSVNAKPAVGRADRRNAICHPRSEE